MIGLGAGKLIRGDDISQDFQIKKDGLPVNITGHTVKFSLKRNINDVNYVLGPVTLTITDAINGLCNLTINKSVTATWELLSYYYDIEVTTPAGIRTTPIRGVVEVVYDITI